MNSLQNSDTAKHIIIANVIIFALVCYGPMSPLYALKDQLMMYYFDYTPGGSGGGFKPWQPITHMFLHGGFWHLAMNMYGLFLFGRILERVWGSKRFLFFYFATGLGAGLLYMLVEGIKYKMDLGTFFPFSEGLINYSIPVLGASGAVFGVLIAFAMLFPNTELMLLFFPAPIKAKYLIGAYVAYELFRGIQSVITTQSDGVAHFAHLGGALFGFIIVKYWQSQKDSFY